jgi:hypothetical protein
MINKEQDQKGAEEQDQNEVAKTTDTEVESVRKMLKRKELQTKVLKKIIQQDESSDNK